MFSLKHDSQNVQAPDAWISKPEAPTVDTPFAEIWQKLSEFGGLFICFGVQTANFVQEFRVKHDARMPLLQPGDTSSTATNVLLVDKDLDQDDLGGEASQQEAERHDMEAQVVPNILQSFYSHGLQYTPGGIQFLQKQALQRLYVTTVEVGIF